MFTSGRPVKAVMVLPAGSYAFAVRVVDSEGTYTLNSAVLTTSLPCGEATKNYVYSVVFAAVSGHLGPGDCRGSIGRYADAFFARW